MHHYYRVGEKSQANIFIIIYIIRRKKTTKPLSFLPLAYTREQPILKMRETL